MEEKKNVQMHVRVTEEEKECIYQKMEQVGISSIGTYLRKMALNGYCITMDMSDVKEMRRLLRSASNNINQYAKKQMRPAAFMWRMSRIFRKISKNYGIK